MRRRVPSRSPSSARRTGRLPKDGVALALLAVVCLVALGLVLLLRGRGDGAPTQPAARSDRSGALVDVDTLPREVERTLRLIDRGGPFPYRRDGVVFANRERRLPARPRGHYREYTVRTPGSDDRGARRVVAAASGERWYSPDHYRSFTRVRWPDAS